MERLNVTSPDFDALEVLTAPQDLVELPNPNAPIYDNMSWFVETEDGIFPRARLTRTSSSKKKNTSTSTASTSSQQPQQDKGSVNKRTEHYQNVLTRMDTVIGPLQFLKKCMNEKLRVKVHIRRAVSIRGFCIGFVEAFDKHMNMVLKDVYETWKRPRKKSEKNMVLEVDKEKRKKPCEDEENNVLTRSGSTLLHKHGENGPKGDQNENGCYRIPRWIVKRRAKKKDICERHVDQLLIQGKQVVTVMLEQ